LNASNKARAESFHEDRPRKAAQKSLLNMAEFVKVLRPKAKDKAMNKPDQNKAPGKMQVSTPVNKDYLVPIHKSNILLFVLKGHVRLSKRSTYEQEPWAGNFHEL